MLSDLEVAFKVATITYPAVIVNLDRAVCATGKLTFMIKHALNL